MKTRVQEIMERIEKGFYITKEERAYVILFGTDEQSRRAQDYEDVIVNHRRER